MSIKHYTRSRGLGAKSSPAADMLWDAGKITSIPSLGPSCHRCVIKGWDKIVSKLSSSSDVMVSMEEH